MNFALTYARDRFAVFPCRPMDKQPLGSLVPNGVLDATTDEEMIRGWWTKCPNANIGIATGKKSGMSVVDLDGPEGIASGKRLHLVSPVTALTGNGKQLYFSDISGQLGNSVKKLAEGVDTRGNQGYVIAPPSLHPSGKRYIWEGLALTRKSLTSLPTIISMEKARSSLIGNTKSEGWISEALKGMRNGNIDNTLVSILGRLRRDGYSASDALVLLQPHALAAGATPGHLNDKVNHIWKAYPSRATTLGISKSETIDKFLEDIKEPEWICKPFIAKKSIGFVVGLPETLKTWLCTDLAVESVRESGEWLGIFPVNICKTLFIDQERWKGETQRRFRAVLAAKGMDHQTLRHKLFLKSGTTIRINIDASYQSFRTELLEMKPDLVVVDSFATFHTSPENDRSEIQKVLERIKELRNEIGCTFLFINHETKMAYPNGEEQGIPNMGTMAGSVAIGAAAEFCLIVRKVEDNMSIVHHVKSTLAQKAKSFYASVSDVPEGIVVMGLHD